MSGSRQSVHNEFVLKVCVLPSVVGFRVELLVTHLVAKTETKHTTDLQFLLKVCECVLVLIFEILTQKFCNLFYSKAATRFSTCSINTLKNTVEKGYAQCLFDEPVKVMTEVRFVSRPWQRNSLLNLHNLIDFL